MPNKNEQQLLKIVRYAPSILILIITILFSVILYFEHKKNIISEKKHIEKQFISESKKEIKALIDATSVSIEDIKDNSINNLKNELREQVYNGYSIAYKIFNKYKNTKTKEEITELIKATLKSIKHSNGRRYYFIYELDGMNILNANFPDIEGKNLWNYKDAKGTLLLQEMKKILTKKSETFYEWHWYKDKEKSEQFVKLGFFKKFEPYDWFIGTGEYIDDFSIELKNNILTHIKKLRYKDDRYIFITDDDGQVLVNKYPKLIGSNIIALNAPFKSYYDDVSSLEDGVFTEYTIDRSLTFGEEENKISYLKLLDDWNWIIGTGFDLNNAKTIIKNRQEVLEEKYNSYLKNSILAALVLIFILLIASHTLSKYIEKIFFKYKLDLEDKHHTLVKAQKTAHIGDWKLNIETFEAYWSDEILNIFGIEDKTARSFGPESLKKLMYEEDWPCFKESLEKAISDGVEHSCTYRVSRENDGEMVWIDCRGKLSKSKNMIYGTVQDITKRKLLEEEKKQKEILLYQQSKMAAMGEMLGNIAHQWRQPLSIISTAATGAKVQSELGLLNPNNLGSYFDTINSTSQHLSQTIEDFRTFFDPKQNKITIFKIESTIEKTLNLIHAQFAAQEINIIKNIENDELESMENELIQALVNVLNNSRDALIESSQEKYIFIDIFKESEKLIIDITDNAGGIDNKFIDRVFEPYFTTKHQSHGTGIGLYMSREIVYKLLGGSLDVENKEFEYKDKHYKGAKFRITLNIN